MKVVVRKAGSGVAAASSLLVAASGTAGCAVETRPADAELTADATAALDPGSATLLAGGWPGSVDLAVTNSTTDEYVRVNESLTLSVPAWLLWETLYPTQPVPEAARLQQLQPTITVTYLDGGQPAGSTTLQTSWTGADVYAVSAVSTAFVVPAGADALQVTITIGDAATPESTATLDATAIHPIPVFGGELPAKTALFDNYYSALRTRIIEGGNPVKGSTLTIGYTDWRADTLVSRSSINTQIGVYQASSRFGYYHAPIYGAIVHEVSVGYFFDDGRGWQSEQMLDANTASRILSAGRTDYEKTLTVPASATHLSMYFHVKTYLVADYSGINGVTEQWYGQGSRNLVREKWDNPNGSYTNYDFSLDNP